jgi:hypothetical protein
VCIIVRPLWILEKHFAWKPFLHSCHLRASSLASEVHALTYPATCCTFVRVRIMQLLDECVRAPPATWKTSDRQLDRFDCRVFVRVMASICRSTPSRVQKRVQKLAFFARVSPSAMTPPPNCMLPLLFSRDHANNYKCNDHFHLHIYLERARRSICIFWESAPFVVSGAHYYSVAEASKPALCLPWGRVHVGR